MTDIDFHYLRSILDQLRELQSSLEYGPTLGGEVLADNINWLDYFIDKHHRALEPKP
jgi:hemerythrin-like domain-containing protein